MFQIKNVNLIKKNNLKDVLLLRKQLYLQKIIYKKMRKIIAVVLISLFIVSCGSDSKKEDTPKKVEITDKYVVILDAIYEKNDSCMVVIYDENDNEILDKRVKIAVKGMENSQKIQFDLPDGFKPYNIGLGLSTSKDQNFITLSNISILNNNKIIAGSPEEGYLPYFSNNDCLQIDTNTLKHTLKHDKPYPPGLVGNETLKSALTN